MTNLDALEQSEQDAKKAMALLAEHKVPPTPSNYDVWLTYARGESADLKKEVDAFIANGREFSSEVMTDLYARHCISGRMLESVSQTNASVEDQINNVLNLIDNSATDTKDYSETLRSYGEVLSDSDVGEQLKQVLSGLLEDTRTMEAKTRELNSELVSSAKQINQLRSDLKDVTRESLTDPLTELSNRKEFDSQLAALSRDATSSEKPLTLILGDVDHFKRVNDNWGHQLGDQVLKLIARVLRANVNDDVVVARYGGEEFGVIFPNTTVEEATRRANKIREVVASKQIRKKNSGETIGRITMSFGVAGYVGGQHTDDLIRLADSRLYAAKDAGRNQVVSHDVGKSQIAV